MRVAKDVAKSRLFVFFFLVSSSVSPHFPHHLSYGFEGMTRGGRWWGGGGLALIVLHLTLFLPGGGDALKNNDVHFGAQLMTCLL